MARPPRIGVLGGTFDPVHIAHLATAVNVRAALELDRVLLVVAHVPWQKAGQRDITPAEDRFAVVEAAVDRLEGVEASRIEIDRGGESYTVDTLEALAERHPGAELFLIMGGDVFAELHTWVRADELGGLCTLAVVDRPGPPAASGAQSNVGLTAGWPRVHVEVPALHVSSTELRGRRAEGRPIDVLVPPAAVREIERRGLYARVR